MRRSRALCSAASLSWPPGLAAGLLQSAEAMHIDDPLTDPLDEEATAAVMAQRARAALDAGDDAVFFAELDALCRYLAIDLESLFAHEETDVFPRLEACGLTEEVAEAKREHRDLRRMRSHLASECPSSRASARHLLGAVARLLAPRAPGGEGRPYTH